MGITLSTALAFALTSLLIELTPGPNMTYLALVGVQAGRRAGYAATLGVALGLGLVGVATALGLSALIAASPMLYAVLRWVGVAYLLYLAWEAWRDSARLDDVPIETDGRFFMRGLITNLLNPKAAVFYVAVLPTFLDPTYPAAGQALALSAIYVLVATAVHATIVTLASFLRPLLVNKRVMAAAGKLFAFALVCVALWLAWSTR
jgi:threonine/homoserine/homoserine lactone efflux protein